MAERGGGAPLPRLSQTRRPPAPGSRGGEGASTRVAHRPMTTAVIGGRGGAAARSIRSLRPSGDGPQALVLSGEPGIGKTVLWEEGVSGAKHQSRRVLVHRSVEAETSFSFTALSDLVAPVFDDVAPWWRRPTPGARGRPPARRTGSGGPEPSRDRPRASRRAACSCRARPCAGRARRSAVARLVFGRVCCSLLLRRFGRRARSASWRPSGEPRGRPRRSSSRPAVPGTTV